VCCCFLLPSDKISALYYRWSNTDYQIFWPAPPLSHLPEISTQCIRIIMLGCGSSSVMLHSNPAPGAGKPNPLLIGGYLKVDFQNVWQLLIISLLPCFLVIWVQPLTLHRLTDDKVWVFHQSEIPPAWSTKLKTWTQKTSSCYPSIAPQHFYFQIHCHWEWDGGKSKPNMWRGDTNWSVHLIFCFQPHLYKPERVYYLAVILQPGSRTS